MQLQFSYFFFEFFFAYAVTVSIFPNYLFMKLQFFFLPELILHKYSVEGYSGDPYQLYDVQEFVEKKITELRSPKK